MLTTNEQQTKSIEMEDLVLSEKICGILLTDRTSGQNVYWATDSYEKLGDGYTFHDPVTVEKVMSYVSDDGSVISGDIPAEGYHKIIRPRAVKSMESQKKRTKDKAEVFTPSWVCNEQVNLIDEAWFGRKEGLFNSPDSVDPHKWVDNKDTIIFPEGKTWMDYVSDVRLEITCGEAPYLCGRYDAVTGECNPDVRHRIGILDRKLRVVSENVTEPDEWIQWAKVALRSSYGFEWQGDSLFLARKNVLMTLIEHYVDKFGEIPSEDILVDASVIISWNLWQMDGLKGVLPDSCGKEEPCEGCRKKDNKRHNGVYCIIRNWKTDPPQEVRFVDIGRVVEKSLF